jgi:hypothetical protein
MTMTQQTSKAAASTAPIRHGDIILTPITGELPETLKAVRGTALATGTATGHSHRFAPAAHAKLYDSGDGVLILRVAKAVKVSHEEHETVTLGEGDWRVTHKRQYDAANGWVNVVD